MTDQVSQLPKEIYRSYKIAHVNLPPVESTHQFVDELVMFLFPVKGNRTVSLKSLQKELRRLHFRLSELLYPLHDDEEEEVTAVVESFFNRLPDIYEMTLEDANAFLDSDPSAKGIEEIIMSFPGFYAISVYRIAHELHLLNVPLLPRIMSEYLHSKTGIDIHPAAKIGKHFFIDHGTGVVIGETTEIGDNVKIYQGVTLGALFVERALRDQKRHPTIQDNVIIYAGTTILGGKTVIGRGSVIGGNVWLTESVEPLSLVYHQPQIVIRDKKDFVEPINFFI
jgi:serine O-acetyltransferase